MRESPVRPGLYGDHKIRDYEFTRSLKIKIVQRVSPAGDLAGPERMNMQ